MRPLNILWLIDHVCYDGDLHGGGRLFMNLVPRFDATRVRIHPYFIKASPEVKRVFSEAKHPVVDLARSTRDPMMLFTVDQLRRRHEVDVMHLFCYSSSTFGRAVGRVRGVPTVIHDFDTQIYFPYPWYLRMADRVLAGTTGRALAASAFCKEYMRDVRRVPGDRIDVMYHAIPDSLLKTAAHADRAEARRALGWSDDTFVFTAITKLGPDRGNETLLAAFRDVVTQRPEAKLALVYKPTLYHRVPAEYENIPWIRQVDRMRDMLQEHVQSLGLQEHVQLIERSGSLEPYYAAADMQVAPFESVRFSSVNLIEGLAFGTPFIGTDLGEPREISERLGIGTLVPPKNPPALAKAMLDVLATPGKATERRAAAQRASSLFSVDAAADRLAGLYESLLSGMPERGKVTSRAAERFRGAAM